MLTLKQLGVVALAMGLCGCVTPIVYGPISAAESAGFGYADHPNADGSHTIRVVASTNEQAHEFWDRRAGELCNGAQVRKSIYRAEIPVVTHSGYVTGANGYGGSYTEDRYGALIMEGLAYCEAAAAQTAVAQPVAETQP